MQELFSMEMFKPPAPANLASGNNLSEGWRRWELQFETYFNAAELSKKEKKTQVAILLHTCGPEAQDIFRNFEWADGESKEDYKTVLKKLRAYCEPRKNQVYERHKFWQRNQHDGETVDQ